MFKWAPDPGAVEISKWPLDPAARAFKFLLGPGAVGTSEWPSVSDAFGAFERAQTRAATWKRKKLARSLDLFLAHNTRGETKLLKMHSEKRGTYLGSFVRGARACSQCSY